MTRPPAALILAGSRPGAPDPVAASEGVAHKALAEAGGLPLLERVANALRAAGITRIAVSADAPEVCRLAERLGLEVLAPGSGPAESVGRALEALGAPLVVTTADHALLQSRWVTDFIADAPPTCDLAVLLARREAVEMAAPGSRRTWLRFADGSWSGCNLFLFATPRAQTAIRLWRRIEVDRKRPWRLTARIGIGTLVEYLLGRLTLSDAVARLGARNGIGAVVVAARDGLAAVDVDRPGDLAQVRAILARSAGV